MSGYRQLQTTVSESRRVEEAVAIRDYILTKRLKRLASDELKLISSWQCLHILSLTLTFLIPFPPSSSFNNSRKLFILL